MRFCEEHKIVMILEAEDHAAGVDGDSVNMENYGHVTFIILFGELTGNAVLTINSGATDGTKTTAETFNYRATAADLKAAAGDTLGTEATSAALTLTAATYEDRMVVVEMDADEFTDGQPFVTPALSADASELFASITAILSQPRFAKQTPPTAIPTS
ncbi:hypothetical protein [Petrachloros mirabilis]